MKTEIDAFENLKDDLREKISAMLDKAGYEYRVVDGDLIVMHTADENIKEKIVETLRDGGFVQATRKEIREDLIHYIEDTMPLDSDEPNTQAMASMAYAEAVRLTVDWRDSPLLVLIKYAELVKSILCEMGKSKEG